MKNKRCISIRKAEVMCILVVIVMGLFGYALGESKGSIISSILELAGVICFMIGLVIIIFDKIQADKKVDFKED